MVRKVLHVTECYAGGVSRAIVSRTAATPEFEHHLLWTGLDMPSVSDGWVSTTQFPTGFFQRVHAFRNSLNTIKPDVVHAHSSWAGVYTRVLPSSTPVIYEPHCFKFDDPSLPSSARLIFRASEKLLAKRTTAFAALSEHEEKLMRSLRSDVATTRLPNVPSVGALESRQSATAPLEISAISMVGRICPQKDPLFFIRVVEELRARGSNLSALWIGDGDHKLRSALEHSGVTVTGWLSGVDLVQALSGTIYVHSAAYEGFPLSVLDAASVGAPIAARSIPSLDETPLFTSSSPSEIADWVLAAQRSPESRNAAYQASSKLLAEFNPSNLGRELKRLYEKCAAHILT